MADKYITRAANIVLTSTRGPALHQTPEPMPDTIIFTLTDRTTGQSVSLDEDMMSFIMGEVRREIDHS